ncbi:gamma-mobile-trio protein GmtX [Paraburkholderia sp. BR13444]|uniref:gamma-mobile-trio protein GmtX n=1 Tax=Paraburkholderia sp. BR13444 TaxID=3236997 RepID=UPI0034CF3C7F
MRDKKEPTELLETLLKSCKRRQKEKNLRTLNALCAAQLSGNGDFSLSTIGRLWEVAGGIKARALYNAASEDYRILIDGWRELSDVGSDKKIKREDGVHSALLRRIPDLAARGLVQGALIERDKLRAELNMLKSVTYLDITPIGGVERAAAPINKNGSGPTDTLTPSEREALSRAISQEFLAGEGWSEGRRGEILNAAGRRLFEAGFTSAIRKILDS